MGWSMPLTASCRWRAMLEWRLLGVRCRVSLLFPALLTALLLWQPDGLSVTCVLASVMHECGHLLAMLSVGCPPDVCTLGAFGMRIEAGQRRLVGYRRALFIAAAGPLVNGAAALVLYLMGERLTAAVHLTLGAFNLLPASALDGGEILRCALCLMGQERHAAALLRVLSALILLPLAALAGYLALSGGNITLLLVGGYLTALVFFHPS